MEAGTGRHRERDREREREREGYDEPGVGERVREKERARVREHHTRRESGQAKSARARKRECVRNLQSGNEGIQHGDAGLGSVCDISNSIRPILVKQWNASETSFRVCCSEGFLSGLCIASQISVSPLFQYKRFGARQRRATPVVRKFVGGGLVPCRFFGLRAWHLCAPYTLAPAVEFSNWFISPRHTQKIFHIQKNNSGALPIHCMHTVPNI